MWLVKISWSWLKSVYWFSWQGWHLMHSHWQCGEASKFLVFCGCPWSCPTAFAILRMDLGFFFITELWPFLLGQTWLFLICSQVLEGFYLTGEPMYNFSTKMSSTWLKGTPHHRPVHSLLASMCNVHNEQIPVHLFVKTSVYLSLSLYHFVSAGVPNM